MLEGDAEKVDPIISSLFFYLNKNMILSAKKGQHFAFYIIGLWKKTWFIKTIYFFLVKLSMLKIMKQNDFHTSPRVYRVGYAGCVSAHPIFDSSLNKDQFLSRKSKAMFLCAHPIFSGFFRPNHLLLIISF